MENVDKLIESLCEHINTLIENKDTKLYEQIPENVRALAKLVTARASSELIPHQTI